MKTLSWNEFNSCIESITIACKNKRFSGVYGFPRGGLCLAVAMSHSLNIPFLKELQDGCLVVDDVYETGKTLRNLLAVKDITAFVWYSKITPKWWYAVEVCHPDEWLVFPWENIDRSEADMKAYQMSRSKSK